MFTGRLLFCITALCTLGVSATETCRSAEDCDDVTLAIAAQIKAAQNLCTALNPEQKQQYEEAIHKLIAAEADVYAKAAASPVFNELVQLTETKLGNKPQHKLQRECQALLRRK